MKLDEYRSLMDNLHVSDNAVNKLIETAYGENADTSSPEKHRSSTMDGDDTARRFPAIGQFLTLAASLLIIVSCGLVLHLKLHQLPSGTSVSEGSDITSISELPAEQESISLDDQWVDSDSPSERRYNYAEYELDGDYRISYIVPGAGSQVYMLATACDENGYLISKKGVADQRILGYTLSDSGAEEVFSYAPDYEQYDDYYFISSIATATDGSLWCAVEYMRYEEGNGDQFNTSLHFVHLDSSGQIIKEIETAIGKEYPDGYIQVDRLGNLYYLSEGILTIFDGTGEVLFQESYDSNSPLSRTSSGDICCLVNSSKDESTVCVIDADSLAPISHVNTPNDNHAQFLGNGGLSEHSILLSTTANVYDLDLQTGESETLVQFSQYRISSGSGCYGLMADGSLIFLQNTTKAFRISALRPSDNAS